MNENLEIRCREFIENRDTLKRVFRMENSYLSPVCANIFCPRGIRAEEGRLRQCDALLKANMGMFSNFRGTLRMPVVSMLAVMEAPDLKIKEMGDHYRLLKQYFFGSQYLALVAMLLTETEPAHPMGEVAARGRTVYDRMKKEHPFLTSSEDSVFAVLLALSEKSDEQLIAEMEDCYDKLKTRFHSSNDVQAASHVLALAEGTTLEKTARMIALFDLLADRGRKYGKYHELPVLAAVSALPAALSDLALDILAADEFLAGQKGYSVWSVPKKTRLMHAAMLTAGAYTPHEAAEAAAMGSTVAMIAAQQAAMCAVIASSAAAHSAANS